MRKSVLTLLAVVLAMFGIQVVLPSLASATASLQATAECDTYSGEWGVHGTVDSQHDSVGTLTWHSNVPVTWDNQPTSLPPNGSAAFDLRVAGDTQVLSLQVKVDWPERGATTTKNLQLKFPEGGCNEQNNDTVLPEVTVTNPSCDVHTGSMLIDGGNGWHLVSVLGGDGQDVTDDLSALAPDTYEVTIGLDEGYSAPEDTGVWTDHGDGTLSTVVAVMGFQGDCRISVVPVEPTVTTAEAYCYKGIPQESRFVVTVPDIEGVQYQWTDGDVAEPGEYALGDGSYTLEAVAYEGYRLVSGGVDAPVIAWSFDVELVDGTCNKARPTPTPTPTPTATPTPKPKPTPTPEPDCETKQEHMPPNCLAYTGGGDGQFYGEKAGWIGAGGGLAGIILVIVSFLARRRTV